MSEQNNPQATVEGGDTIDSNHILFDRQLLARKKEIIEEFLRNEDETSDVLINYPNDFLQKLALAQLKEFGKLVLYRSAATIYIGEVCNELYHGYGLLVYRGDQLRFNEGYFQNNCKYGYGLEYINGDTYVGKFVNNKPQDNNGLFFWSNQDVYHGSFVNGMKHGQGKWQSGEEFYSGSWKYNKPEGEGFIRSAISEYKGDIKNGYKHGKGLEMFNNGDRYEGHYSNGKPEGNGAYFWSNGSVYRGEFKNGLRFGYGIWQFGSEKYEGPYINDKRNGQGKYTWGGGSYYIGSFVEDLRHGFGEMHWDGDSFYKGQWFEGSQNGEGEVWEGGKLVEKGYFENGKVKIVVSKEEAERRLLPLSTLDKKVNSQANKLHHSDRKRFNSFQPNRESLKLEKLKGQRTTNQFNHISNQEQKRQHIKEGNKRYSAVPNKTKAPPINRTFRASSNVGNLQEKSREKEEQSAKTSINKINLYKRVRKQKQSQSLAKKLPLSKLPKATESELLFETQLAPIKWRNFNHISHN